MINKVIHYCWFGDSKKSKLIENCINSWKMYCPDYEIIEWNESNCDLTHPFVVHALKDKKWAFVADYIRLYVLFNEGGIYLDTDMMLVNSLDPFLKHNCFFGAEEDTIISAGIIGCTKNNKLIFDLLKSYDDLDLNQVFDYNNLAIPIFITSKIKAINKIDSIKIDKVVSFDEVVIYPQNFFYPFPNKHKSDIKNYLSYATKDTVAIHLWNASWVEYNEFDYLNQKRFGMAMMKILRTLFITRNFNKYYFKRVFNHYKKNL